MTGQQPPTEPNASQPGPAPVPGSGWVQPAPAAQPSVEGSGWVQPAAPAAAAGPAWGQPQSAPAEAPAPTGWVQPQPTPGWVQSIAQPKGSVTILVRLAGVFLVILGIFWGAVGALLIVAGRRSEA